MHTIYLEVSLQTVSVCVYMRAAYTHTIWRAHLLFLNVPTYKCIVRTHTLPPLWDACLHHQLEMDAPAFPLAVFVFVCVWMRKQCSLFHWPPSPSPNLLFFFLLFQVMSNWRLPALIAVRPACGCRPNLHCGGKTRSLNVANTKGPNSTPVWVSSVHRGS